MAKPRTQHYVAFGLHVESEIPLDPFLPPFGAGASPDVQIRLGIPGGPRARTDLELDWPATARLLVRAGGRVLVEPASTATPEALAEQLGCTLPAIVLERAGTFVLHASAVAVGGAAIAFTGVSGSGKSSTAALLASHGCALIADDYVPIRPVGENAVCLPGPRIIKLTPQARDALSTLRSVGTGALSGKHLIGLDAGLPVASGIPLAAVYVLEDGDAVSGDELTGQAALVALLRHAFCLPIVAPSARTAHLVRCAEVARRVAVRRLIRPRDWTRTGELAAWVIDAHAGRQ